MGLPNISINFKSMAAAAIARSQKGVVGLILKDANTEAQNSGYVIRSTADSPAALDAGNRAYIERALVGYINPPRAIRAFVLPDDATDLTAGLAYFATVEVDYLCGPPDCTSAEAAAIAAWVKSRRAAHSIVKAVLLYTQSDDASAALYGVLQTAIKQADGQSAAATVTELFKKSAPEQKITVNNLGDISCVTGGAVLLHEPYTNLYGKFYIDSDLHQWKNGVYTNKLTLNLTAVMDEKSAGQELEAAKAAVAGVGEHTTSDKKYPKTGGGEE